jgi:glycosyltransferase involved in cell wall biosynthesis
MRDSLERLVRRLGLADRVIFTAHLGVEDIWASNHVLIMPSRFEGLPLAVVEAMLCGRPVVATDVAGHSEIIKDGVTGFLADAPTADSMDQALERFWARRTTAQMMGEAGSTRIRRLLPPDPVRVFTGKLREILRRIEMSSIRAASVSGHSATRCGPTAKGPFKEIWLYLSAPTNSQNTVPRLVRYRAAGVTSIF